jgi:hypothetical protein
MKSKPPTPKPLPPMANYFLRPERMDEFCYALSDLLCWMDGFKAAGGTFTPGSLEVIRDLSCNLKTIQSEQTKQRHV